jgi:hypothetical protein
MDPIYFDDSWREQDKQTLLNLAKVDAFLLGKSTIDPTSLEEISKTVAVALNNFETQSKQVQEKLQGIKFTCTQLEPISDNPPLEELRKLISTSYFIDISFNPNESTKQEEHWFYVFLKKYVINDTNAELKSFLERKNVILLVLFKRIFPQEPHNLNSFEEKLFLN